MAEISQLLENAWKTFCEFNEKRYRYDKQPVCWKEMDVMGHLMRFLYEEFKDNKVNNLDIHLDCSLTSKNFDNESYQSFCDSLRLLQIQFGKRKGLEVDMAISNGAALPFELCLEAKHFHYPPWKSAEELIIEDIGRLQAYKKLKITKSIAFAVLDDYLLYEEQDQSDLIEDILNKYKNKMQILYYHYP